jgi:hypothetical protein
VICRRCRGALAYQLSTDAQWQRTQAASLQSCVVLGNFSGICNTLGDNNHQIPEKSIVTISERYRKSIFVTDHQTTSQTPAVVIRKVGAAELDEMCSFVGKRIRGTQVVRDTRAGKTQRRASLAFQARPQREVLTFNLLP